MRGTIYLLHFEPRFRHASHYLGWAKDVDRRLQEHLTGTKNASPLVRAALAAGCKVTLVKTWEGDRHEERRMKNIGSSVRHCPVCRPEWLKKDRARRAAKKGLTA